VLLTGRRGLALQGIAPLGAGVGYGDLHCRIGGYSWGDLYLMAALGAGPAPVS